MKNLNILVVEENNDLVVTLKKYFEDNSNIRIRFVAKDGLEAINLISTKKDEYDLILMDPIVPKLDGLELIEEIKERNINKPIFIVSSLKDNEILERSNEFNIINYVLKPFDLDNLTKKLNRYLENQTSYLSTDNEINSLKRKITRIMHELGVPSNLKGYNYLRDSILFVYYDSTLADRITKGLYPKVSEEYSSTVTRVERSMRHAIEVSWNRGNWDMMEEIFGYSVSIDKAKPTNSEFIVTIADKLRLDNNKND